VLSSTDMVFWLNHLSVKIQTKSSVHFSLCTQMP